MTRRVGRMILLALTLGIFWISEASSHADDLDGRIRTLEDELTKLKEQQVELKKEATAAAAALPTFEYRPGNGLNIEAGTSHGVCVLPSRRIFAICLKPGAISRAG